MKIDISARNSKVTQRTKDYAEEKAEKLEKFSPRRLEVLLDEEGGNLKVEAICSLDRHGAPIVASATGDEWFPAIDEAYARIESQLRKIKEKAKSHRMRKYEEDHGAGYW